MKSSRLDALRVRYERAKAKRQRADEVATRATMRLSDAEEAEAVVFARLLVEEHRAGLHAHQQPGCRLCAAERSSVE